MVKWDAERQQLRDEIARAQREERCAKQDRNEANETIRRARTEDDEYKQWMIFERGDDTSPRTSRPKSLGSDTPMSPQSGANLNRRSRDKQTDEAGMAITAIAQSMLTEPPVTRSNAHLTPQEEAKWVAHQRVQLKAGTFDARTLSTTISERSWTMIGFKISSSRILREYPSSNWKKDWTMDTFLEALEEVYALEPKDRFMETVSIGLARDLVVDPTNMGKQSEKYVAYLVEKQIL